MEGEEAPETPPKDVEVLLDEAPPAVPKRYIETVVGAGSNLYAIALCVVFALEMIGPIAVAVCVRVALGGAGGGGSGFSILASLRRGILALWLLSEAFFYLSCLSFAFWQDLRRGAIGPPPFSRVGTLESRREIWKRILADPAQSPRDFVESWMYRDADLACDSPPKMLVEWARRRVSTGGAAEPPSPPPVATCPTTGRACIEPFGVPLDDISRADIEHWLCRSLFGKFRCSKLSRAEADELAWYVDELEAAAKEAAAREDSPRGGAVSAALDTALDYGKGVAGRLGLPIIGDADANGGDNVSDSTEAAKPASKGKEAAAQTSSMSGPMDKLRWRHRPLLFYGLTHFVAHGFTPRHMRKHGFIKRTVGSRREGAITYWHRAGSGSSDAGSSAAEAADALVFIHGIGFGVAPYVEPVMRMGAGLQGGMLRASGDDIDILMLELPAASQRAFTRMPPSPERFGELVESALDSLGLHRAVIVGHSLGSAYATYVAHSDARRNGGGADGGADGTGGVRGGHRRVSGMVLIDPIAVNLHHARTTREVVFTRLDSAQASFEDFLFKKELWTSTLIARHLPWYEASFWLDDCNARQPTLIAVASLDTIITPARASQGFGSWRARLKGVRVLTMEGIGHGGWLQPNEASTESLVAAVHALRQEAGSIAAAGEYELTW